MLTVRDTFPTFHLSACISLEKGKEFKELTNTDFKNQWLVVFAWPMDFTFVCPTEIAEFGKRNKDFLDREAQILGVSTDTHFVHAAWRKHHADLKNLPFPMLADTKKELCSQLGILEPHAGIAMRATYLVDPNGVVRWVCVNDMKVGRNVDEVLRVLDALQTDELCPCNWKQGDATLEVA